MQVGAGQKHACADNENTQANLEQITYLSQPRLVSISQKLTSLFVHIQSLLFEFAQAKALDVLLQLCDCIHGLDVAHDSFLARSPPNKCEPGL